MHVVGELPAEPSCRRRPQLRESIGRCAVRPDAARNRFQVRGRGSNLFVEHSNLAMLRAHHTRGMAIVPGGLPPHGSGGEPHTASDSYARVRPHVSPIRFRRMRIPLHNRVAGVLLREAR